MPDLTADVQAMLGWIAGALILVFVTFRFTMFLGSVAILFLQRFRGGQ